MGSVYRIRKEQRQSGPRYIVDYRDNAGRRTMRRFKRARDAEAFKKQVEASTFTGVPIPRPAQMTFTEWAHAWFAQREALSNAGKKPRPSALQSWRSDLQSFGMSCSAPTSATVPKKTTWSRCAKPPRL